MTFWHPALKLLHWTMALMLLAMVAVRVDIASVRIDAAQAQGAIAGAEWLDAIGHPVAVFEADGFIWQ